jgi:uncharacterized protein
MKESILPNSNRMIKKEDIETQQKQEIVMDFLTPSLPNAVHIRGWIGEKLHLCIENRVMVQDLEAIIAPFRDRNECNESGWRCEYWGKWFTSAMLAYCISPTEAHWTKCENALALLLATEDAEGYIGTYRSDCHLGIWDVWGRKYVLLGLLAHYDVTGNKNTLEAAVRIMEHLMSEAPIGEVALTNTGIGVLKGLASSSILEPLVLLYQRTGTKKFLQYAQHLVGLWNQPSTFSENGLRLVEDTLCGIPPLQLGGSPKAYEMMSCFEGLCELYRVTGDESYRHALLLFAESVRTTERTIVGSASNHELWCDGTRLQTEFLEQPLETCVTVTWMKLCFQLLRLTGDCQWADELERSLFNSLLAAMTTDGSWWAYWCPLHGERVPSVHQHNDVGLSCCVANGPRALLLTPFWATMATSEGPVINLYAPSESTCLLPDGTSVKIIQETDYPKTDTIELHVEIPSGNAEFALHLRIPAWSEKTYLTVNGEAQSVTAGHYAVLKRRWLNQDRITLVLDLRGRLTNAPSGAPQYVIERGPLVLSLDNRFPPFHDVTDSASSELYKAVYLEPDAEGRIPLELVSEKPADVYVAFSASFVVRPTHFFRHHTIQLTLCDFASAGNHWSAKNNFRTWLPQPLFLAHAFPRDTWHLMYPGTSIRPQLNVENLPHSEIEAG